MNPSFGSLWEAFVFQVEQRPGVVALQSAASEDGVESLTWNQLGAAVAGCAARLQEHFRDAPEMPRHVGHLSDNSPADIVIALACMSVGAIEVPFDHRLHPSAKPDSIPAWKRVGGLWLDPPFRQSLLQPTGSTTATPTLTSSLDPDAASLILWTSGTTGQPRGVTLSHRNLVTNAAAKLKAVPQTPQDRRLTLLPLSHAYARTCDFGTWLLSGCKLAISLGFSGFTDLAPPFRPTLINSVPRLAIQMLQVDVGNGLSDLRLLGCGGAAIAPSVFEAWRERGVTVVQGYGQTETSPVVCSATPENATPGLVGTFVDGWEHEIRAGQLFVRGPHTMLGYWDDPQATSQKIDPDGWLATGDLAEQDSATGQWRILGRVDELIVLDNARKLYPQPVEREVLQIAGVKHAMLAYFDQLELWLDLEPQANSDAIMDEVRSLLLGLAHCKRCRVHFFAEPLSRQAGELTAKGTLRRANILRNRFADRERRSVRQAGS